MGKWVGVGWEVLKEDFVPESSQGAAGDGFASQRVGVPGSGIQAVWVPGNVLGEKRAHTQEAVQVRVGSLAVKPLCFLI